MNYKIFLFIVLSFLPISILAQKDSTIVSQEIFDAIEAHADENDTQEEIDQEQLYDDLYYFSQFKIDINHTKKEQLERLQFLSDRQIEALLYYIYQYGPMKDLSELQLIDGFYLQDIRNLLPYVSLSSSGNINPLRFASVLKYGKSEVLSRTDYQIEKKEGYKYPSAETWKRYPNKQYYLGEPYYESFRYKFHYKDRVYFGFTTEKDPGEPFFNKYHKGFDFYSAHFQINDIGHLKTFVLGDYNVLFGQGLMINTHFGLGKSCWVNNVETRFEGLQKYSSCNEFNYMRGIGTTLQFGRMEYTEFYSYKDVDGPLNGSEFTSIKQDGYHRTSNEISRKNTVSMQMNGFRIAYKHNDLELGCNLLNTWLGKDLQPKHSGYSYYDFSGDQQHSYSFDYRFRWHKFRCFGETAMTNNNAAATLNALTYRPSHLIAITLLHRTYSKQYHLFYSSAFSENTKTTNESGLYLAAEINPLKYWCFATYIDVFKFPWKRYGVPATNTKGFDFLLQSICTPTPRFEFITTFRFKEKDDRLTISSQKKDTIIVPFDRSSLKLQLKYTPMARLSFKTILAGSYTLYHGCSANYGRLLSQDVRYEFRRFPLTAQFRYEYFNTDTYENRIYTYENDVLYAFSIPSLYGRGYRYYLNLRYKPIDNLSVYLKLARTTFTDRNYIGSGLDKINDNHCTTLRFLLRYTFSISQFMKKEKD